jgi:hypothetical protein
MGSGWTLDESGVWRTLEQAERRALGGLTVFRGGFTEVAARAVVSPTARQWERLRDRGLVLVTAAGPRFALSPSVARLAALGLDPRSTQTAARRHRAFFVELCRRAWRDRSTSTLLREEEPNLTVAFLRGLRQGRPTEPASMFLGWTLLSLRGLSLLDEVSRIAPGELWIAPDLAFVETHQARLDLLRKPAMRAVCRVLVDRHRQACRRGLDAQELFAASHPGERISDAAAVNRIRVVIAALRRQGLRELLVTRGPEYLLDPATRVVEVA